MPTISIAGRVFSSRTAGGKVVQGEPIEGATLRLRRLLGHGVTKVRTDAAGAFRIARDTADGEAFVLRVEHEPGFETRVIDLEPFGPGDRDRDLGVILLAPATGAPTAVDAGLSVSFTDLRVMHDMDAYGPGEIYVRFDVNGAVAVIGPISAHGDMDGGQGDKVTEPIRLVPPVRIALPRNATEVRIRVSARDDDAIGLANNPFTNPGKPFDDLGTTDEEVFGADKDFGRGTERFVSNDNFAVSYRIE
jgi:hypothetical protein